jgi:hypothetical protein
MCIRRAVAETSIRVFCAGYGCANWRAPLCGRAELSYHATPQGWINARRGGKETVANRNQHRGGTTMRPTFLAVFVLAAPCAASGAVLVSQTPVAGGGVSRWSQLWQDPGPNGNDLDGDSVCWADFTLTSPATISRAEWWGSGACELGFQIEFWKQDPATIAYQPIGLFYYGGVHSVQPEPPGFIRGAPTTSPAPGGLTHYVLDLPTPVTLAANDAINPRWFVAIIGLTHQAFYPWNWAQGVGGSTRTFQFVRGDGHTFRSLGEGRALLLQTAPGPGDFNGDGAVDGSDFLNWQTEAGSSGPGLAADGNGDGAVNEGDLLIWRDNYGAGGAVALPAPEPAGATLLALAAIGMALRQRLIAGR